MTPPPPENTKDAEDEARRKRKRENDRKAQRVARERSKKRIEHLEFLLENLRKDERHDDSTELADRLEKATAERDALLDSLRSIEALVQRHISKHADIEPSSASGSASGQQPGPGNDSDDGPDKRPPGPRPDPPQSSTAAPTPSEQTPSEQAAFSPQTQTQTEEDCLWSIAKRTLHRPEMLPPPARDAVQRQDVPVRAALEGWDAVERSGRMTPFWAMLRQVDEMCLAACGPVERIGFLFAMHTLMIYHVEPSQENFDNMPPYYWMRPSQALPHAYAADYFPWPGLRERFVFSEHRYANQDFTDLFPTQLRVAWPYDLADIYTVSPLDGTYAVTPLFSRHIRGIHAWTMRPDFFARFPELLSDIPVSDSIPGAVGGYRYIPVPVSSDKPRHKDEDADDDDGHGASASARQMVRHPAWNPVANASRKRQRSVPLIEPPPSPGSRRDRRPRVAADDARRSPGKPPDHWTPVAAVTGQDVS